MRGMGLIGFHAGTRSLARFPLQTVHSLLRQSRCAAPSARALFPAFRQCSRHKTARHSHIGRRGVNVKYYCRTSHSSHSQHSPQSASPSTDPLLPNQAFDKPTPSRLLRIQHCREPFFEPAHPYDAHQSPAATHLTVAAVTIAFF